MRAQRPFWTTPATARIAARIVAGLRQTAKIDAECLAKAAVVADSHMGNHADGSAGQDREARVGPADVRKQHLLNGCAGEAAFIAVVPS